MVPVSHFAYTSSNAPRLTPAFAIKTSFHRKTLQTSRLWAMGEHYIERWLSYDPITDFVPESNTLFTSAAPRPGGKQLVFIRLYDICTDATPRWCRTGPQGRVREVLCWGSPRRPGKAARDSKGHSIGLELRLKRGLAHSTVCQCQCQCQ